MAAERGRARRVFVLDDVAPLQATRAVHGQEPPADPAERGDGAPDPLHRTLHRGIGPFAERGEDTADAFAMVDLFGANPEDLVAFVDGASRAGVAGVREDRP